MTTIKGIMQGYENHTFKPTRNTTRAEAAIVIYNILKMN